ncbi:MAG TPA: GDSL-type esterase/lipase family protein [Thermoanaerobaculia bacterium]|nr:GDSL-type esterase/lipase family protein [Thermoanaerobaculia bacterium]
MRKLALTFVAFCIALLAAEGLVRLLGAAPEVGWVRIGRYQLARNPKIGFEPIPAFSTSEVTNDLVGFAGKANRLGFRDREHEVAKPLGVFRILVLGDSVGQGLKVPRYEDTFPALLEARLQRRGVNAEVINLSVTGYNTQQEVETLAEKGLRFSPDLVLVAYTLSDRERLDGNIMETLLSEARIGPARAARRANPYLVESALYRFLFFRILAHHATQADAAESVESARALAAISGDTVAPSFATLRSLAHEHHFRVLVAIFPYFVNLTTGYEYQKEHASAARDAERNGFEVLDLLSTMQRCRQNAHRRIQEDSFHPNEIGHRCAATAMARKIFVSAPHKEASPLTIARKPRVSEPGTSGTGGRLRSRRA